MQNANSEKKVLVQVVPVGEGREVGWGESTAEQLRNRLEDIRLAVKEGVKAVADSLEGLPGAKGWGLGEVSAKFGVTHADGSGWSDSVKCFRRGNL